MHMEQIREILLSFPGVTEEVPFGPNGRGRRLQGHGQDVRAGGLRLGATHDEPQVRSRPRLGPAGRPRVDPARMAYEQAPLEHPRSGRESAKSARLRVGPALI